MTYGLELQNKFSVDDVSWIFDCKFVPNQEKLAVLATIEGDVIIVDVTGKENNASSPPILKKLQNHHKGKPIRKLGFLNDHDLISASKTIKIYDLNQEKFTRQITNQGCKVYAMKVIDEHSFVTGDDVGGLRIYDLREPTNPVWSVKQCEEYISDLDLDASKRMLLASSGDGSLNAINIRTKKLFMQSEPFDAGFQSVRFLGTRNKVVVGAEDGAINIFNVNEYGNISDRFPINCSRRKHGECSVDSIEVISNDLIVATGSDCKLRLVNMFPNRVLFEANEYESSVETLAWNPDTELILSSETNVVFVHKVVSMEGEQVLDEKMDEDEAGDDSDSDSDSDIDADSDDSDEKPKKKAKKPIQSSKKSNFFADL